MSKLFFDVFPTFHLENELGSLLKEAEVRRITTTENKNHIKVYLFCNRLIQKPDIKKIEEELEKQLFDNRNIKFTIYESCSWIWNL